MRSINTGIYFNSYSEIEKRDLVQSILINTLIKYKYRRNKIEDYHRLHNDYFYKRIDNILLLICDLGTYVSLRERELWNIVRFVGINEYYENYYELLPEFPII